MSKEQERGLIQQGGILIEPKLQTPRQIIEEHLPEEDIIETLSEKVAISWRRNFDKILAIQEAWKEVYPFKDEVRIKLDSEYPDVPHLLGFLADPHIGAIGQSPRLGKDIDLFLTTPNTSLACLGDMADFGIWGHKEVRFLQGLPIPIQRYTVKNMVEELVIPERNPRGKQILLLDLIGGHTYEAFQTSGLFFENYLEDLDLPLMPGMGRAIVKYGEQSYEIALAHRYWGNSRLNKCLSPKRLIEYVYPNADISVVAHQHWKAGEWMFRGGKKRDLLRPGHYRSEMPIFEQTRGYWEPGNEGMVCILVYPDKKRVEQFDDIEAGMARLAELCELDDYRKGFK